MKTADLVNALLVGATILGSALIGLFFLRFWRKSRDRLFLLFAIAFWLYGLNRLGLSATREPEGRTLLYGIRFLAFVIIFIAIFDKNRRGKAQG